MKKPLADMKKPLADMKKPLADMKKRENSEGNYNNNPPDDLVALPVHLVFGHSRR